MFNFVSPFDACAGGAAPAPSVRQKPVPTLPQDEWPGNAQDSRQRSVDNMLEQLTRGQPPPANTPGPEQCNAYLAGKSLPPPPALTELDACIAPPKQQQQSRYDIASPHGSPPKVKLRAVRPQAWPIDSTDSFTSAGAAEGERFAGRRTKESSLGPRGGAWKYRKKRAQNGVFHVGAPLGKIQAPKDDVQYTAIVLVKVESPFQPRTTIGTTYWVACAMFKRTHLFDVSRFRRLMMHVGHGCVISWLSGDRTLLELPRTFPPTAVVSDMAVYGNRLAGVTLTATLSSGSSRRPSWTMFREFVIHLPQIHC
jgi:hypothetical protein